MTELDLITVKVMKQEELPADHADLYVKIQGGSIVSGGQALEKAREVAQLVRELAELGVPQEDVHLQGASADVSTGTIMKTSQASYRLKVHCAKLEALPSVLGVITSQKNTALSHIEWGYPDEEALKDQWLEECVAKAHAKAHKVASGLGVKLAGVHSFTEEHSDPEAVRPDFPALEAMAMRKAAGMERARVAEDEFGLDVTHAKMLGLRVTVEFRVSGYEGGEGNAG